jgi:hypothetical protein
VITGLKAKARKDDEILSTPQVEKAAPEIAKYMNEKLKIVANCEPFEPGWSNVGVISVGLQRQVMPPRAGSPG